MKEPLRNQVIALWHAGTSQREIARRLGIARNTIGRAVADHLRDRCEGGGPKELGPKAKRKSKLDRFEEVVKELVEKYPNITAVRLLEELQTKGFSGGYSIVKERLRALRPRPTRRVVERFETGPGVQAQMDYSPYDIDFTEEGRRRVNAFSYILAYSRRQYIHFVEHQDFITTIREHVKAFEYLEGVAAVCLYDRMKVVVNRVVDGEPIYNVRFLAFATHYGFRPWACWRPQTKGKVERPFDYIENNLLNARTFRSLDHLNEVTAWWLTNKAEVRGHRTTKRRPIDLWAEERSRLLPLPQAHYDVAEVAYTSVNPEGRIAFWGNQYTVPWQRVGELVVLRATETELIVYTKNIRELCRHALLPRRVTGQVVVDKAHLPSRDRHRRHELLLERYAELGEVAVRFLDGLLRSRHYGKNEAHKVLSLLGTYREADVLAALARAVRYSAFSFAAVERILSVQAEPRPPMESLAEESRRQLDSLLDDPRVPPRSAAEYQDLLDREDEVADDGDPQEA